MNLVEFLCVHRTFQRHNLLSVCVCMCSLALITTLVLCARSQEFVMSVSVRSVHVVFSFAGFKGGRKPCRKTRETSAPNLLSELRRNKIRIFNSNAVLIHLDQLPSQYLQ